MAVKFSDFSPKQLVTDVTDLVGYLQAGELNVKIPPANLDTTYAVSTGNAGASPTISLQGTKPNQPAITPSTVSLTGSGATLLAGNGSTTIDFASTAYAITSTDTSPAGTVPLVLTGTGGGDAGTDTVNLVGAGGIGITSSSNTVTITGSGAGSNTTYTVDVPAATTNINLAGSDGSNDAITLVGGTEIQLVRDSASQITINSQAASYSSWTVAGDTGNTVVNSGETATIAGGTGIITDESGRTVTANIDYAGADNAILAASAATVAAADTIWFSDAGDSTIKKGVVSDLPFNETLQEVCTAGNTTTTAILAGDGTVSLPSLAFTTEPDTGMYRSAANALSLVTGGAAALTIDANQNGTFNSTGATTLPVGDDAARPTPTNGMIRYSTTANGFEGYINGAWGSIGGGVTITKEQETGNGTTTDFTLTTAAGCTVDNLAIYISGVYQNKLDASGAANFTVGAGANPTLQFVSGGTPTAPPVTAANGIEIVITR